GDAFLIGHDVHAVVGAVGEVDVGVPRRPEHNPVAIGRAVPGVRGRIVAAEIRLDLHDSSRRDRLSPPVEQTHPEKVGRHLQRRSCVEIPGKLRLAHGGSHSDTAPPRGATALTRPAPRGGFPARWAYDGPTYLPWRCP